LAANVFREVSLSGDMRSAAIAGRVSIMSKGHFDEVISSIDKMVKTFKDEEATDLDVQPQVSIDFIQTDHSNSVDAALTMVMSEVLVRVVMWYAYD